MRHIGGRVCPGVQVSNGLSVRRSSCGHIYRRAYADVSLSIWVLQRRQNSSGITSREFGSSVAGHCQPFTFSCVRAKNPNMFRGAYSGDRQKTPVSTCSCAYPSGFSCGVVSDAMIACGIAWGGAVSCFLRLFRAVFSFHRTIVSFAPFLPRRI